MTTGSHDYDTHVDTDADILVELLESVGASLSQVADLIEAAQSAHSVGHYEDAMFAAAMASAHAQSQTAGLLLQMSFAVARMEALLAQIIINTAT